MELRKPQNCPRCGSSKLAGILYGRPTAEGMEAVDRGELIFGSCFISLDQADWECMSCRYQWFDAEDPARIRRDQILNDLINRSGNEDLNEQSA